MTTILTASDVRLDPAITQPPFGWTVRLPTDWIVLDTHPLTWSTAAERLIDDRLAHGRPAVADRRSALDAIGELVTAAQRGDVLLSLLRLGRLDTGTVATAGLHVAWHDSSPEPATLATVRAAVGRTGVLSDHPGTIGPVSLLTESLSWVPSGQNERIFGVSYQAYLPVPGQSWTAVVASAACAPELEPVVRAMVLDIAGSIEPLPAALTVG